MKPVYLFNELGFFTGVYLAQESPLEEGVYLTPEASTGLPPPEVAEGQLAQFDGTAWSVFTPPAPEPAPFPDLQAAKRAQIEQWRDEARYADVTVEVYGSPHPWQIDPISSQLILSAATNNKVFGFPLPPTWRTADNIDVPISINDLAAIIAAGAIQTQMAYAKSWALKAQVAAASTQADLDAIVW